MKRIYWSGICSNDRLACISRIQECIVKYGFITDYKFFSDLSAGIVIQILESHVRPLYEDLTQIINLSASMDQVSDSESECEILFNITFSTGTGNLRIEVPAVPG